MSLVTVMDVEVPGLMMIWECQPNMWNVTVSTLTRYVSCSYSLNSYKLHFFGYCIKIRIKLSHVKVLSFFKCPYTTQGLSGITGGQPGFQTKKLFNIWYNTFSAD